MKSPGHCRGFFCLPKALSMQVDACGSYFALKNAFLATSVICMQHCHVFALLFSSGCFYALCKS